MLSLWEAKFIISLLKGYCPWYGIPYGILAMSHIIDTDPSCHGKVAGQQVWQDVMTEEYQSIMKNDVWDIVLRLEWKYVVTSKWIYKIITYNY